LQVVLGDLLHQFLLEHAALGLRDGVRAANNRNDVGRATQGPHELDVDLGEAGRSGLVNNFEIEGKKTTENSTCVRWDPGNRGQRECGDPRTWGFSESWSPP